jgi:hypothetical protein
LNTVKTKQFLSYEWDAIAGVLAAVVAIVLHLLHIVDETVVLPILLALLGLLFINFMRHTRNNEITAERVEATEHSVARLAASLNPPDVVLIGPRQLRTANERFVQEMQGDTVWYNVCLSMYAPPALFDGLLRPAIENPRVMAIQLVLDEGQRDVWERLVRPQVERCPGATKVREPDWRTLERNVSFILADSRASGRCEALLSFWGEPFMAQATDHDLPRFIFHVQPHSELLTHLVELHRAG